MNLENRAVCSTLWMEEELGAGDTRVTWNTETTTYQDPVSTATKHYITGMNLPSISTGVLHDGSVHWKTSFVSSPPSFPCPRLSASCKPPRASLGAQYPTSEENLHRVLWSPYQPFFPGKCGRHSVPIENPNSLYCTNRIEASQASI